MRTSGVTPFPHGRRCGDPAAARVVTAVERVPAGRKTSGVTGMLRLCVTGIVFCTALLLSTTAVAQSAWTSEVASEPKAGELRQLLFDRAGHGVALWVGADMARAVSPFSALSLRAPGAGWRRGPDLTGIRSARPGVFTYGRDRLLLVQALERLDAPE